MHLVFDILHFDLFGVGFWSTVRRNGEFLSIIPAQIVENYYPFHIELILIFFFGM